LPAVHQFLLRSPLRKPASGCSPVGQLMTWWNRLESDWIITSDQPVLFLPALALSLFPFIFLNVHPLPCWATNPTSMNNSSSRGENSSCWIHAYTQHTT
jgi:hypothetical protein